MQQITFLEIIDKKFDSILVWSAFIVSMLIYLFIREAAFLAIPIALSGALGAIVVQKRSGTQQNFNTEKVENVDLSTEKENQGG